MMSALRVILFLLKILGLVLLGIIGLILLLLLLVLVVPIRYRGKVVKSEQPENGFFADGKITWLFSIVRVRIRFIEKKLRYTVRLFGLCICNSEKPKKEKKKRQKKHKESRKERKNKNKKEFVSAEESEENSSGDIREDINIEGAPCEEHPRESCRESSGEEEKQDETEEKKKDSFFAKVKSKVSKILGIPGKIKERIRKLAVQIKLLGKKKEAVFEFLQNEIHILAFGKAVKTLKKMLGHVLPGKFKGVVEFGTGDPESTGKALAGLGIVYAAYGKGLTVIPDFSEKRLVANVSFRGRIRLGTLLLAGLRLLFDKSVKTVFKNWKKLLKVLKEKAE